MSSNVRWRRGWDIRPLSELVFFQEGPGLRNWQYRDSGVPFVNIRCIKNGRLIRAEMTCISPDEVEKKYKHFLLDSGDYVVSSSGTLGRLAEVGPQDLPCMLNTSVIRFRPLDSRILNKKYLKVFLSSHFFTEQIIAHANGSAQLNYGPSHLQQMTIVVPPLREQQVIGDFFGALDDRIALLRETNATLEAIAQALFKSWFVDFDPVHAKANGMAPAGMDEATAALFPDGFEDSELGQVPRGWTSKRLDSFIDLAYGKALKATDRVAGQVPVYGSGGITGFHNESLVCGPCIIVGRKGTVGSLYWEDLPFFPIDTVFYVRSTFPMTYCFYLLKTLGLADMNTDAAVPGLNRNNVYRLKVTVPPVQIIDAFNDVVAVLRDGIFSNQLKEKALSNLRDTLLPRLISGKLRIPEAEAAVEEALQ